MSTTVGTSSPRRVRAGVLAVITVAALVVPGAPAARAEPAAVPAGQFVLTAAELVIDGLRIEGSGPAPRAASDRPALRLALDQAIGRRLALSAPIAGAALDVRCPERCRLAGRPARLHVVELTATPVVAGLPTAPVTLTSSTPAPALLALLRLPRLTLRDVRGRLVLLTGAELSTPGTRIDLHRR